MKPTMKPICCYEINNMQHLNKATILCPLSLHDMNDCFCICSKIESQRSSRFLNVTLLSGHKVSFMHEKTTSNTLQCLQNELQ